MYDDTLREVDSTVTKCESPNRRSLKVVFKKIFHQYLFSSAMVDVEGVEARFGLGLG